MALRKAASVLPEPVGAAMSVCRPSAIASQPRSCAAVGAPSDRGQSFAQFLLGLPSHTDSYIARLADYAEQSTTWGFFARFGSKSDSSELIWL